jgi:integrase/recombinase XerD
VNSTIAVRGAELQVGDPHAEVMALRDAYSSATKVFNDFLQERGLGWTAEGITAFREWLGEPHDGRRLAANSINYYVKGVKARIRLLMDRAHVDDETRERTEKVLAGMKYEKVADEGVSEERCLSYEQIGRLVEYSRKRNAQMALLVEFLAATGCRISETLTILCADVRQAQDVVRIKVHGKGSKERTVMVSAELVARIRAAFKGGRLLFGHGPRERPFTRQHVSVWIARATKRCLGRSVSAHALRHSWASDMLRRNPGDLAAISKYLGHSQISTTTNLYIHGHFNARDVLEKFPHIGASA